MAKKGKYLLSGKVKHPTKLCTYNNEKKATFNGNDLTRSGSFGSHGLPILLQ